MTLPARSKKSVPDVRKFRVGDPVYAFISISNGGGYAEYSLAKENQAALKPATLSFAASCRRAECRIDRVAVAR